jgi:hypothetical protein
LNPPPLNYLGDPNKNYVITLPVHKRLNIYIRVFFCAQYYFRNVSVIVDHDKIAANIPSLHVDMTHKNNTISSFFMVNDHLFMVVDTDHPIENWQAWIPHYSAKCSAFFVAVLRTTSQFIFDNCPIPVHPFPNVCGPWLGTSEAAFEYYHSLGLEKTIPIYFHGRFKVRPSRKAIGRTIRTHFPEAQIEFREFTGEINPEEYIKHMSKAKIAWCPKSEKCVSGHECNAVTGKEIEAMCLEAMVLKPTPCVLEVEERIAGVHFVEINTHSLDIVEKIQYYLDHDDERKEIAHNGRLYWERNLSPWARTNFMLTKCIEAMGENLEQNV